MRDPRRGAKGSAGEGALRQALRALLAGDETGAESALEAMARADSSDEDAYLGLAAIYRGRGEVGRAIRIHQNLLLQSQLSTVRRAELTLRLAADLRAGGFRERAIATYEEVLTIASRQPDALAALVELDVEKGDGASALEYEKRLARCESGVSGEARARRLCAIGRCAYAKGRSDVARKAVKRALRCDAAASSAYGLLAALEAERGRNRQALNAWCRAAECDAGASEALLASVGAGFAACDHSADFEAWLRARLDANPRDGAARCALAERLAADRKIDEAVNEAQRAISYLPAELSAHALLGRLLLSENRRPDALKAYEAVLEEIAAGMQRRDADTGDA